MGPVRERWGNIGSVPRCGPREPCSCFRSLGQVPTYLMSWVGIYTLQNPYSGFCAECVEALIGTLEACRVSPSARRLCREVLSTYYFHQIGPVRIRKTIKQMYYSFSLDH